MFNFDQKTLYTMLIIIAILGFASIGMEGLIGILLTLPGVLLAMTVHEYSHAKMADHYGDTTARNQGRLTLNPIAHIEPIGIFLLIFAHIGWGKPVQVNPNNFTSNKSKGYCEAMISLAGPMSNFILAILLTVIQALTIVPLYSLGEFGMILATLIEYAIIVNIGLGVFNLIPLPPLDGEKIFKNILPTGARNWLVRNGQMLEMLFLILWITGLLGEVVSPVINCVYTLIKTPVSYLFGLFL